MHKIKIQRALKPSSLPLPLFSCSIPAGFASPADDYIDQMLDLNELMVAHPAATFFVRAIGDSMQGAGIASGDILVVDRSIKATNGKIIVAILNGEFTVKRLMIKEKKTFLVAENSAYSPLEIKEESDFQIWGIVTYVIHKTS